MCFWNGHRGGLQAMSGEQFCDTSPLDFRRLLDDPTDIAANLYAYIAGFSDSARDVLDKFDLDAQVTRPDRAEMGSLYEELIRRFSECSSSDASSSGSIGARARAYWEISSKKGGRALRARTLIDVA